MIITPPLPVLFLFRQSAEIVVQWYQFSKESPVAIDVDLSIEVWPSDGELYIEQSTDNVGLFRLAASREGVFKVKYSLYDDVYEQPEDGIVLAVNSESLLENITAMASVLVPGCCFKQTNFHLSHCSATGQLVSLSSTCSFAEGKLTEFKTQGVVFVHSGDIVLPLSIAGLDSDFSSVQFDTSIMSDSAAMTCDACFIDGQCQNYTVSADHTYNMLVSHSLVKTFFAQIKSTLPSSIAITVPDMPPSPHARYYPYSFHASLIAPSLLPSHKGCEQLEGIFDSGVVYVFRGGSQLIIGVGSEEVTHKPSEPVCVATNLCDQSVPVVHAAVSLLLSDQLLALSALEEWVNAGWVLRVDRVSLIGQGVARTSGDKFYNGTHLVFAAPLYNIELKIATTGMLLGDLASVETSFIGSAFLLLESNVVSFALALLLILLSFIRVGTSTIIW